MKKIDPKKMILAAELLASNMTVKEIAKATGVTERTVRRWGKRPEIAKLVAEEAEEARALARQQTSFIAAATVDRAFACLNLLELAVRDPNIQLSPSRIRCVQTVLRESRYWSDFLERSEEREQKGSAVRVQGSATAIT